MCGYTVVPEDGRTLFFLPLHSIVETHFVQVRELCYYNHYCFAAECNYHCYLKLFDLQDMDEGRKVWVPDPVNGYVIGCIKDIGTNTVTVEPRSSPGKTITASYDQVFLSEEYEDNDVDDNCMFLLHSF